MELKKFTLKITCYGKLLSIIENVTSGEICNFIENHNEPLPENSIKEALSKLQINETMEDNSWHINEGKLLGMIPKYHREIKLTRLS